MPDRAAHLGAPCDFCPQVRGPRHLSTAGATAGTSGAGPAPLRVGRAGRYSGRRARRRGRPASHRACQPRPRGCGGGGLAGGERRAGARLYQHPGSTARTPNDGETLRHWTGAPNRSRAGWDRTDAGGGTEVFRRRVPSRTTWMRKQKFAAPDRWAPRNRRSQPPGARSGPGARAGRAGPGIPRNRPRGGCGAPANHKSRNHRRAAAPFPSPLAPPAAARSGIIFAAAF